MGRSIRRRGRESAVQVLFQMDAISGQGSSSQAALSDYFANFTHAERVRDYISELVQGVETFLGTIDEQIEKTSTTWRLVRMSAVDRNVLRMACFELLHKDDVPTAVVINEAVEIARRYGSESSPGFVNGILDEVARSRDTPESQ